jgi:site-specific DNA recombinase
VKQAALYTRVSTDDQAREGFSLPEQEARGRQVAAREGWDVTVYSDPGRSGADRDRPELARMMHDVEAGQLDVVWFASQDRLARDVGATADLVASFIEAEVEVWEDARPLDLGDDGQAAVDLKALFAAWERRKIKARTRSGIAGYRRAGKHWGTPPYGQRGTADGLLEDDPVEAPIKQRIFREYLALGAFNAVARVLTADGVPTRSGGAWGSHTIRNILARPQESIVSPEDFTAAQRLAEQSRRWTPKGGGRLPANHLFVRGSLRCVWCESAMLPRTCTRTGRETYQCATNKTRGSEFCAFPILRRADVEETVLRYFEQEALGYAETREHVAAQLGARADEVRSRAAGAEREAGELRVQLDRVTADYRRGALPAEEYVEQKTAIRDELAAAEAQAGQLAEHLGALRDAQANLDAEDETLRRITDLRRMIGGQMRAAGEDVGALRTALAMVAERWWAWLPPIEEVAAWPEDGGPVPLRIVPEIRAEAVEPDGLRLRRVPIRFGVNNQHGTVLWKYMTQNTFRLSKQ